MDRTPKHIVAVSALVTNENGEVLLVKTHWRSDTWESPGGQVEEGEGLDQAVIREVLEETGITIRPIGVTGVYYNATRHILSVVFKAKVVSGELSIQPEEIMEAGFFPVSEADIGLYITRPNMLSRTLDAMRAEVFVPYETVTVRPDQVLSRLDETIKL
ncbi:NUDIX hydrolase [Chungangia koreensis]|uniref:NUDIX hydrolase n=1 Tax=Chungangia koreensis TaxID=752657 RepID=A0ABV8X1Q1_9LACT